MPSMPIDNIQVGSRRKRSHTDVTSLANSITEIGLLNPITVSEEGRLIAGLHRLQACKYLGWTEVPVQIVPLQGLKAELAEIDENLTRDDLTVLERGEYLKARKEIYEALHPETKHGGTPGAGQGKGKKGLYKEAESASFQTDVSSKTGRAERTIREEVQIATNLTQDVKEAIRDTEVANSKTELLNLARLKPEEQKQVADKIVSGEAKNVQDARRQFIKNEKKELNIEEALLGKYPVIYADPPWSYQNKGFYGSPEDHYPILSTEEIKDVPVKEHITTNAVLFLWTPNPLLEDALDVLEAWGFEYKTNFVWIKDRPTYGKLGFYVYGRHELLLVGIHGSFLPEKDSLFESVISAPKGEHSHKPQEVYEIIERMYPNGPYLELFAREVRQGWDSISNEELP